MYIIAVLSFIAIILCLVCIYSTVDTNLTINVEKMKAHIIVIGITTLIFGFVLIGSVYFIFNPYILNTYTKTTSIVEDEYKYFTEWKCETALLSMTDECSIIKKYKISYKITYGDPEPVY